MKKILSIFMLFALLFGGVSCNNDDNNDYLLISGNGELSVEYQTPLWLYRLVVKADESEISTYLLGAYCSVDNTGELFGSGPAVYFTVENSTGATTLPTMNLDVASNPVYYSKYVNFSSTDSLTIADAFVTMTSGTLVVQRWGSLYNIKILGLDSSENDVVVAYSGYLYANFYTATEEDTEDTEDTDDTDTIGITFRGAE